MSGLLGWVLWRVLLKITPDQSGSSLSVYGVGAIVLFYAIAMNLGCLRRRKAKGT